MRLKVDGKKERFGEWLGRQDQIEVKQRKGRGDLTLIMLMTSSTKTATNVVPFFLFLFSGPTHTLPICLPSIIQLSTKQISQNITFCLLSSQRAKTERAEPRYFDQWSSRDLEINSLLPLRCSTDIYTPSQLIQHCSFSLPCWSPSTGHETKQPLLQC